MFYAVVYHVTRFEALPITQRVSSQPRANNNNLFTSRDMLNNEATFFNVWNIRCFAVNVTDPMPLSRMRWNEKNALKGSSVLVLASVA